MRYDRSDISQTLYGIASTLGLFTILTLVLAAYCLVGMYTATTSLVLTALSKSGMSAVKVASRK